LAKQLQQISLFSNYFEHNWIMPHVETEAKEKNHLYLYRKIHTFKHSGKGCL